MLEVIVTSADLRTTMDALGKIGVRAELLQVQDAITMRFFLPREDLPRLRRLAQKQHFEWEIVSKKGLYFRISSLKKRPVLLFGLLLILLFSLWVPTRIFFVEVEGEGSIPVAQILYAAEQSGLRFGVSRRALRSEQIKNAMLEALPQLQWVGVNTRGCCAVITVRPRQASVEALPDAVVSSIVADCDGIVRDVTVRKGNGLCVPGQTVKKGEVLISAFTDCGLCVQATRADGEVYAETERRLTVVSPTVYRQRTKISASGKKISLIIGKKRINFFKGSGISGSTCAKIYTQKNLTLPGGFILPIAIACERWYDYDTQETERIDRTQLSDFAADYLPRQLQSGKILLASEQFVQSTDSLTMEGIYRCYEMIGRVRPEDELHE